MSTKKELRYYKLPNGKSPFVEWITHFKDKVTRIRIERRLERMELGHYGDCEPVGEGVYELRLHFGSGYRVYFVEQGDEVLILLCGGDKSTQSEDIRLAKQFWRELRGRLS